VTPQEEYYLYEYEKESELEDDVSKNLTTIFGDNCLFCPKIKLKSYSNMVGGIPDGLLLDFNKEKMYIVEIELGTHDLYEHITPQMTRFKRLFQNPRVRENIVEMFYNLVKSKKDLIEKIRSKNEEVYRYLKNIVDSSKTNLILVIDVLDEEKETIAKEDLNVNIIVEFKKYKKSDKNAYKISFIDTQEKSRVGGVTDKGGKETGFANVQDYLKDRNKKSVELFNILREKILKFGNIEESQKKWRVYYRDRNRQKTFLGLMVFKRKGRVQAWIGASDKFDDPRNITKKWGNSRWFYIESENDIDYAIKLIKQSYER